MVRILSFAAQIYFFLKLRWADGGETRYVVPLIFVRVPFLIWFLIAIPTSFRLYCIPLFTRADLQLFWESKPWDRWPGGLSTSSLIFVLAPFLL